MSLLLLHRRHTPDDAQIWREAIRRGYRTARIGQDVPSDLMRGDGGIVRYYGNVLHASQIEKGLPLRFSPIEVAYLPRASELGLTKRRVKAVMTSEVPQPFTTPTFVKATAVKWIEAKVYQPGERLGAGVLDTDWVYVQEVVRFVDEVRCFVLDGKAVTGSWYRQDSAFKPEWWGEDGVAEVKEMVERVCAAIPLPRGVVIDVGRLDTGEWALIEANEAWASGLYDCDPGAAFEAIIASQEDR